MNHFKWLALVSALVLAIGFTACSNDDEKKQGGITYAVTSVTKTTLDETFTNELVKTGNGKVTYSSSDTAVAVVNETSGEVTIKGLGVATITATVADSDSYTYFQKKANYTLIVVKPEGSISYAVTNMGKTSVDPAFTNTLTKTGDGTVSFAFNNIDVADVNAGSGEVSIKGPGQAVITATVADTGIYTYAVKTASYTLDVVKPAGSITFASTSLKKTSVDEPFTNALTQTGDGTVTYTSSNKAVAEVDAASGKITIKGLGQATITATVANFSIYTYAETTASYTLEVIKPTGTFTYATASLGKTLLDKDKPFTNALTKTGDGTVKFESSNQDVAVVNAISGEVTIKGLGQTTITATVANFSIYTYAETTASYTLEVIKPTGTFTYATASLGKTLLDKDKPFTNALTKTGDGTVKFESSNQDVAVVNASSGEVTIKGLGQATITATVENFSIYNYAQTTASYTVEVTKAIGKISFASSESARVKKSEGEYYNPFTKTGDGIVNFYSDNLNVASFFWGDNDKPPETVRILKAGTTVITAKVSDSDTYTYPEKTVIYTLSVWDEGVFKFYTKSFTKSLVIDKDKSFTNYDYTVSGDGRLTFSSSDTDVAVVNASSGKVTIKGVGEATITAQIKDTATYVYPVKTAGYQVKVLPYFGEKAPDAAKAVGDIILCDGSAIPYKEGLTLDKDSKSRAVAVIFYVGKDCSDDDTNRTLGVGMIYFNYEGEWCGWGTEAQNKRIEALECGVDNNTHTFTGHKDGSGNFYRLAAAVNDTNNQDNYPPFKFANNYANETRYDSIEKKDKKGRVSGTKYETGWYLPSIAELYQLRKNLDAVNAALKVCDGMEIVTELWWNGGANKTPCGYWASSTVPGSEESAWYYDFFADRVYSQWKFPNDNYKYSCAIHAF